MRHAEALLERLHSRRILAQQVPKVGCGLVSGGNCKQHFSYLVVCLGESMSVPTRTGNTRSFAGYHNEPNNCSLLFKADFHRQKSLDDCGIGRRVERWLDRAEGTAAG